MHTPGLLNLETCPRVFFPLRGPNTGQKNLREERVYDVVKTEEFKSRIVRHIHTQACLVKEAGRKLWGVAFEFR